MGFAIGLAVGFVIGVLPVTRGIVYTLYGKAKEAAKHRGWVK
jgi:preprotein translocase subunit SecD